MMGHGSFRIWYDRQKGIVSPHVTLDGRELLGVTAVQVTSEVRESPLMRVTVTFVTQAIELSGVKQMNDALRDQGSSPVSK